ncbi:hypothetical protein AB0N05_14660 [Nocardia sp. NPDC051030]|uniref:hypothetical protein n=1 Tax=Nocardia sp. NPDC051030 TaxID=3155162 RepID=UPI00344A1D3F
MGRSSAMRYLMLLSAVFIAGCAQHGAAQPVPVLPWSATAPKPSTPATTTAPTSSTEPVSDLPPCGDIATAATSPDCVLRSRDSAGLAFEVRHTGGGAHTVTTVTVLDPAGGTVQTIVERDTSSPSEPRLRDLDNDGRDELIIPIYLATANTRYAIFHATGDATQFRRAGELAGIGIETSTSRYTVVAARAGYAMWDVEFWAFESDRLQSIVTAQVRPIDDGNGKVAGTHCAVVDSGGLNRTGLSLDQASAQFCAEPAVVRVMR